MSTKIISRTHSRPIFLNIVYNEFNFLNERQIILYEWGPRFVTRVRLKYMLRKLNYNCVLERILEYANRISLIPIQFSRTLS